ncbi:MAG: glycosyltransferase family 87 protein [Pseudobdellovibrionaceae bacterium]
MQQLIDLKTGLTWLGIIILMTGMLVYGQSNAVDFAVYYKIAHRVLENAEIYRTTDGWMPFKYHPAWAIFFLPLTAFSLKVSSLIFNIIQLCCWGWSAKIWSCKLNYDLSSPQNKLFLLILCLSALSAEIGFGQVNGFLFLGCTLFFQSLHSTTSKPLLAGFLLALMCSLKINFALLGFYALFKNWRSMFGIGLGFSFLHLFVIILTKNLFGIELYSKWIELLVQQSSEQFATFEVQGLLRFFLWISSEKAKVLWMLSIAIFLLISGWIHRKVAYRISSSLVAALWMTLLFLTSPLAWWYQILFVYPLAFYLIKNTPPSSWVKYTAYSCLFCFAFINFNTIGATGIYWFKDSLGYFTVTSILFFLGILSTIQKDLSWTILKSRPQAHVHHSRSQNLIQKTAHLLRDKAH